MVRSLSMTVSQRPALLQGVFLVAALVLGYLTYLPGLTGAFIFDDWSNLAALGHYGTIESLEEAFWFVSSGFAGPSGRPISLATFLLDANAWPVASAYPFKQTNVLLHLVNGLLLMLLIRRIGMLLGAASDQAAWIGLVSGTIWMLHPFLVSTTLYVVQRMAMLAATFVLLGLLSYLHGRSQLANGRTLRGYFWVTFSITICGSLAILSKENGALLPLFVLVIDHVTKPERSSNKPDRDRLWKAWRVAFLYLPVGLILYKMSMSLPALFAGESGRREFTPYERLLTEAWIMLDYLGGLLVPRPFTAGLFQDDIQVAPSVLHAPTLLGLTLVPLLLYIAIRYRRRIPTVSLAILFYFAGHLLESTFINLELYFEHRNYLPAMLLPLPVGWYLVRSRWFTSGQRTAAIAALLCLVAASTLIRADYWGEPFQQAVLWVQQNPDSPRANNHLASLWLETGNTPAARHLLETSLRHDGSNLAANLMLFSIKCRTGALDEADVSGLKNLLESANARESVVRYQLEKALGAIVGGSCPRLDTDTIEELLAAGLRNPAAEDSPRWRQVLLEYKGRVLLRQGDAGDAYHAFLTGLQQAPTLPGIHTYAGILATAGHPDLALRLIHEAPRPIPSDAGKPTHTIAQAIGLDKESSELREIQRLKQILRSESDETHPDNEPEW